MNNKVGLYVAAKPECSKCLSELEKTLVKNNLPIKDVYKIKDWESLAREMYGPQILSSNEAFNTGFEGHIWLVQHLFGNRGLILVLEERTISDPCLKERLDKIYKAKQEFRNNVSYSLDGTLMFNINLNKLDPKKFKNGGSKGQLGTFDNGRFTSFIDGSFGRWDYFYLKYIHSPNIDLEILKYEWNVLLRRGIISPENKIESREWELMKKLKTFIPPSEYST